MSAPLSPLEIATGIPTGRDRDCPELPPSSGVHPAVALERSFAAVMQEGPAYVSFSGGLDSSVVLAVATRAARRDGLALPVPITQRFTCAPAAQEDSWQELVVRHLGLDDWVRLTFTDELDLLGALGTQALVRHGVRFPPRAYSLIPLLERAAPGTLLTGADGDGLFYGWRYARLRAVPRRERPELRDILRLSLAAAPTSVRRRRFARRGPPQLGWLSAYAQEGFADEWARDRATEPFRWDHRVAWWFAHREQSLERETAGLLSAQTGAGLRHGFYEPAFLAELAAYGGRTGFKDREHAYADLFGDLLPKELIARTDKADFGDVYWGPESERFVRSWQGHGVDTTIVDVDRLRDVWTSSYPDARSHQLLQSAWLACFRDGVEQEVGGPRTD